MVSAPQGKGVPINADTSLEAEADAQGAKAARGEPAAVHGAGGGVQRKEACGECAIQRAGKMKMPPKLPKRLKPPKK